MKASKGKFLYRSFRLPSQDVDIWQAAAVKLQISQSEFLRRALRGKAEEVLVTSGVKAKSLQVSAGGR